MKNDYQLCIFDLDGTILNTLEDLYLSTNYALQACQLPARTKHEIKLFIGNGIFKLIQRAVPTGTTEHVIQQVYDTFMPYYQAHCEEHTAPYEGIPELLSQLHTKNIMTAVVSNKADTAVKKLCTHYFPDIFAIVVGAQNGIQKKPAPDTVLHVIHTLHMQPAQAIYIGDSDVDIQTAKNAGIPCVSVTWGFRDENFLKSNHAMHIIHKPSELLALLSLNK